MTKKIVKSAVADVGNAAPAAPAKSAETITLRAVCAALKIKPRVARVTLRKINGGTLKSRGADERYVFVVGSDAHTAAMSALRKIGTPAAATPAAKSAGTA